MGDIEIRGDIEKLIIGLAWEPNEQDNSVLGDSVKPHNLDLSCVLFDNDGNVIDEITPQDTKRETYKGQIFHLGDNLSGGNDFEDEEIQLWLSSLDNHIAQIAFIVSVKEKVKFSDVREGHCSVLSAQTLEVIQSIDFSSLTKPAVLAFVLKRNKNSFLLNSPKIELYSSDAIAVGECLAAQ